MTKNDRWANGIAGLSLGFILSILLTPLIVAIYYTEMFTKVYRDFIPHCDSWGIVTIPAISIIGLIIGLCKKNV